MDHACNWPGCKALVDEDEWGCSKCFGQLPTQYREAITQALRLKSLALFHRANAAARAWVGRTFNGVDSRPHDPGRWARMCRTIATKDHARCQVAGRPTPKVTLARLAELGL